MSSQCALTVGDLLPLVFRFLVKHNYLTAAEALQEESSFDLSTSVKRLYTKKLTHIVKKFVAGRPELLGEESVEGSAQEEEVPEDKVPEEEEHERVEMERREAVEMQKREFELETRRKMFARSERTPATITSTANVSPATGHFSRCAGLELANLDRFEQSYEAKLQRGGEDAFGRFGQERLGSNKGKNFRKEKTKLKNREFQGGSITRKSNLVDIDI